MPRDKASKLVKTYVKTFVNYQLKISDIFDNQSPSLLPHILIAKQVNQMRDTFKKVKMK